MLVTRGYSNRYKPIKIELVKTYVPIYRKSGIFPSNYIKNAPFFRYINWRNTPGAFFIKCCFSKTHLPSQNKKGAFFRKMKS